jgi:TPR repeat protein
MSFKDDEEFSVPKFILIAFVICIISLETSASNDINTDFCERDCSMEYNFFKTYARDGSPLANFAMAIMNYRGHGRDKNIRLANQQLIRSARAEEPAAMYQLAYNLMFGIYLKQDFEKSLLWFNRANKHGVLNSRKFISVLNSLLKVENENIKSSIQTLLSRNVDIEERVVALNNNTSIERITVTPDFYWSYILYHAELQTCNRNCSKSYSHALLPIVYVTNEEEVLDGLTNLIHKNQ